MRIHPGLKKYRVLEEQVADKEKAVYRGEHQVKLDAHFCFIQIFVGSKRRTLMSVFIIKCNFKEKCGYEL